MQLLLSIAMLIVLLVIVWQDFTSRSIHWVTLPLLMGAIFSVGILEHSIEFVLTNALWNFAFVALQFVLITGYFSFKNRRLTNIVNRYLGIGDLLLFVVLCVGFSPMNFILFFLVSFSMTIVVFIAYRLIAKPASPQIPLAGAMALVFIGLVTNQLIGNPVNFYDDQLLITLLQ